MRCVVLVLAALVLAAPARAAGVKLDRVGTFDRPVYLTAPPRDTTHRYVVQQAGVVRLVGSRTPFLDISGRVTSSGSEQGLLSIAFAPDYAKTHRFYAYFTNKASKQEIDQFTASSPRRADPRSARKVLVMDDPEPNHNGGLLRFGPDGLLYVGTGDGGGGGDQHGAHGNAQDKTSLLGKILRIAPKAHGGYTVPTANPFGSPVFAYGLRNPWRYAFDRDRLIIGDVGQDEDEEIDDVSLTQARGANFGWRVFEGLHRYNPSESAPGAVKPVIELPHSAGYCSVTGGVVVRDRRLKALYGTYVFGDFCKGDILRTRLQHPRATVRNTGLHVDTLASFGEDGRHRVYAISNAGPVYRLAAK